MFNTSLSTLSTHPELDDLLAPCRSRPGFRPADGDFYLRAFDGLVTRIGAGYNYRDNWAISSGGSFPARTPTSIAVTAHRTGLAERAFSALLDWAGHERDRRSSGS